MADMHLSQPPYYRTRYWVGQQNNNYAVPSYNTYPVKSSSDFKQTLIKPNWSKRDLSPFPKNFYTPHPSVIKRYYFLLFKMLIIDLKFQIIFVIS